MFNQRKEERKGHFPTVKDSDHIVVAPAKMLTAATATNDPCSLLVCIKINFFNLSRSSRCSSTPLAGCRASELNRDAVTEMRKSLILPTMPLMSAMP